MPTDRPIDLRSDTVTKPSPDMRRAMAEAEVGDDVHGDDPTVNRLQEMTADLLGKEAALFVPSGTMANQTAIRALTRPGDEIIAHVDSHIYHYESAAPAALAGCTMNFLHGERGQFTADDVAAAIRPGDSHYPRSALVVVENTQNRGGGSVWPVERVAEVAETARAHQLALHLDGARLFNACAASGLPATRYTEHFDTVSVCFSKGLGAPVGSIVAGSAETIRLVHRYRKMFGGGMRQVGIIAAGAMFALKHNRERLAKDHANARRLAQALAETRGVILDPSTIETNIIFFGLDPSAGTAEAFCRRLHEAGVWMLPLGPQRARAVTHLDVSSADIERAIKIIRNA